MYQKFTIFAYVIGKLFWTLFVADVFHGSYQNSCCYYGNKIATEVTTRGVL